MKRKKFINLLIFLLLICSLPACSKKAENKPEQQKETENQSEVTESQSNEETEKIEDNITEFEKIKGAIFEEARKESNSDETLLYLVQLFEETYPLVSKVNTWEEFIEIGDDKGVFTYSIACFVEKSKDGTILHEAGEEAWLAIESLYNNDGSYKTHIEKVKSIWEESGNFLYESIYREGQYKVGVDIPSGEYVIFSDYTNSGYFALTSDSNGNDIIVNENFDYNSIITIYDGEYIELSRSRAVPISEVTSLPKDESDMFKIGVHLPAGEYKLIADEAGGYYCVYNDNRQQDIESNDNFSGQSYVTVKDGQYLVLLRCKIE